MPVPCTRRFVFTCVAACLAASPAWAQARRPEVSRDVPLDLVCGPQAALAAPAQTLKVVSGVERKKTLFGIGDSVIVSGGTSQGIAAGQHFYVRRIIRDRFTIRTHEAAPHSVHTAGWVTILEAKGDVSVARIAEACDGIVEGDYLEPLVLPPAASEQEGREPDFARPARVILGDDRRQMGGEGSLLVIDRGSDHGLRPGQRLTVFRPTGEGPDAPLVKLADAVVASTQHETSLMRIQRSREAIQVGDLVAIHR